MKFVSNLGLVIGHEAAQLFRRDIGALVLVFRGEDGGGGFGFWGHGLKFQYVV